MLLLLLLLLVSASDVFFQSGPQATLKKKLVNLAKAGAAALSCSALSRLELYLKLNQTKERLNVIFSLRAS